MRRFGLALALGLLCISSSGCAGDGVRERFLSSSYLSRWWRQIGDDFHQARLDYDRIFWDLDERPLVGDY